MADDLSDRADAQLVLLRARVDRAGAALEGARTDLDRRHPDPGSVAQDQWAAQLGAAQHVATVRAALSDLRNEQDRIRAALRDVQNPADTATFQTALRDALVDDASLRVELRLAEERVAGGDARVKALGAVVDAGGAAVRAAEAAAAVAARRQDDGEALRTALGIDPLQTVVADANAVLAGAAFSAAEARLAALVPDPLRVRALDRVAEAEAVVTTAVDHRDAGRTAYQASTASVSALDKQVAVADAAFVAAEDALRRYVATAVAELDSSEAVLAEVAALADLSTAQIAALDATNRADAVAAATAEEALDVALTNEHVARRAVDDAIYTAIVADPDADPEAHADVIAARTALADAGIQDPLNAARGDYDQAARDALDLWEVEAPPELWRGLATFARAAVTLSRLADQAERDALVTTLDAAQNALSAALTARDRQVRVELALATAQANRDADAVAAETTAGDRFVQYLRGDGPGGRTPGQL